MSVNSTMMQYFEWYLPNDGLWWKRCAAKAENLKEIGVTDVWLPPAYKGQAQDDVGYGVYDLFDLGEFDQKDTVRTKYGTKEEYLDAIRSFHNVGIRVFADIVLNHRMGADEAEEVIAVSDSPEDRTQQVEGEHKVRVWSKFTFPGRQGKYSDFIWDHTHFSGTDYDEFNRDEGLIYRFAGKRWNPDTDPEKGNYDYLMGMNVDMSNPAVREEIRKWLLWYIRETGIDGLRLDAVKHISFGFYRELLHNVRSELHAELPAVGEYWNSDVGRLLYYHDEVNQQMSLFDVSLHYNIFNASRADGDYDLRQIFDNTLVKERPGYAVTFVDNHDTQYGQSLQSFVADWFKPLAYAIILLREGGTPCVFYSDYYGNPVQDRPMVPNLGKMIKIRRGYAYGEQEDYFDDPHVLGWVRRGTQEHPESGLAVVLSNAEDGEKKMFMGKECAGVSFRDALGCFPDPVIIDEEGWGVFGTRGRNVSVWVREAGFEYLVVTE
ncbi:MAG: alpha-amylase [Eubacteriales bacterium]|nr:alpha-amylase [Eubacteriales bacterium]